MKDSLWLTQEEFNFMKQRIEEHDKYYTPKLEDLYVGYELQLFAPEVGHWGWYTLKETDSPSDFIEAMEIDNVRTPFLTKEQVESELGTPFEDFGSRDKFISFITKKEEVDDCQLWIHYSIEHKNLEIKRHCPAVKDLNLRREMFTYYDGKCPSINEFRKIMSWIGIKN